jgi:hypothetical protein
MQALSKFHDTLLHEHNSVMTMIQQTIPRTTRSFSTLPFSFLTFYLGGDTEDPIVGVEDSSPAMLWTVSGTAGLVVAGLVDEARGCIARARPGIGAFGTKQSVRDPLSQVKEKVIVLDWFPGKCSFCGSTNMQSISEYHDCGAKL